MKPLQFIEERSNKNSEVAYSKLKLLGNYLAEKGESPMPVVQKELFDTGQKPKPKRKRMGLRSRRKKKKTKDAPGQKTLKFRGPLSSLKAKPGPEREIQPTQKRRKIATTPRRRTGDPRHGRRAEDKPTSTRPKDFDASEHGTREGEAAERAARAAKTTAVRSGRYGRLYTSYWGYRAGKRVARTFGRGVRALTRSRKKPHGTNPLTGGTEGSRGVKT